MSEINGKEKLLKLGSIIVLVMLLGIGLSGESLQLQNEFVKLEFDSSGGRITSVFVKDWKTDLTSGDGLLNDNFWNIGLSRFFLKDKLYDIDASSAESLSLSAHHRGGGIDFMKIAKSVTLPAGAAYFKADYTFTNLPAAMGSLRYAFWMQNFIGKEGFPRQTFYPTNKGVVSSFSENAYKELWYMHLSRNWSAFIDPDGRGMAQCADPELLKCFYQWTSTGEKSLTTQEIRLDELQLEAGESIKAGFEFIPFMGLKKVSGAGAGMVGSLDVSPESADAKELERKFEVSLFSAIANLNVKLETFLRILPDGEPQLLDRRDLSFAKAQSLLSFSFNSKLPSTPALYDIEVRVMSSDNQLLFLMNTPTSSDSSMLAYVLEPMVDKPESEEVDMVDLSKFDDSVVTEHIAWARPLAGGPIKTLALTPFPSYRELAELAQRLDIELHSQVWTLPYKPLFVTGDYYGTLTDEDVLNNLDTLLSQEYDLIIIGGVQWKHLRASQRDEIVRKMQSGTGLLEIGTWAPEELVPGISAVQIEGLGNGVPTKAKSGYLSDLLPFEMMPSYLFSKAKPRGEVWASIDGNAWLASLERPGSGRSVSLTWYTGGGHGRMVGGLTPEIKYPNHAKTRTGFWETMHLIMAKSAVYAARREPSFRIGEASALAVPGGLQVEIPFIGEKPKSPMFLRAFARDKENRQHALLELQLRTDENNKQSLKLPLGPFAGKYIVGLQLLNEKMQVLDFGAIVAEYEPEAKISALFSQRPDYRENETAVFNLKIENPERVESLSYEWRDAYGRLLQTQALEAKAEQSISIPIKNWMLMRSYTFTAILKNEGLETDRQACSVTVIPEAEKLQRRDFEAGIWLTPRSADAIRPYLHPLLAEKLREMRMETIIANTRTLDIDFAINYNFQPTALKHAGTKAAALPEAYVQSGDKRDLVRQPCLSDPSFREETRKRFQDFGAEFESKGLRFYWMGDELSLVGYWSNPIDFCFSQHCLKNFGQWLLKRYGSLQAINQQWDTQFASIDELLPETRQEARKRQDGNYSAWADHLEYMDWLLCDFISEVTEKGLRRGDPAAQTFISGPQEASAYGGNDWQQQPGVYSGMMSYNSGALREISNSFHPDKIDLPWSIGYGHRDSIVCYNLWHDMMLGSKGSMAFHATSMINPDYSFSESGQAVVDYLPEIVDGLGKLIVFTLQRAQPQALIVYSQPSIRAAYIAGSSNDHTDLRWKHVTLCKNLGIPYGFVASEQIRQGVLAADNAPRLLILPDIMAIDNEMLDAMESYLGNGGQVLIDGGFASFDQHCKQRSQSAWQNWPRLAQLAKKSQGQPEVGYFKAWEKAKAHRSELDLDSLAAGQEMMLKACEDADIKPNVYLVDEEDKAIWDLELTHFSDTAGNPYLMVISAEKQKRKVKLHLPQKYQVYEAHRVISFDSESSPELSISAGEPMFFALLKEAEKSAPVVELKRQGADGLGFEISGNTSRDTVYHLQLVSPDGSRPFWYRANIEAPAGKGSAFMQLCLEDSPGGWHAEVRDVMTGKLGRIAFRKE
ncbi:MAG: beta-galactosidase [Lentisphaeria bacterium]|nr:beta-galactosidase [Lentisphaeria bacterium]